MNALSAAEGLAGLIVAIAFIVGLILRATNKKIDNVQVSLNRHQNNVRVLALLLSHMIPAMKFKEGHDLTDLSYIRSQIVPIITDAIELEEKWRNPLSSEEIGRLKRYREAIKQGHPISLKEAQDMKSLAERMDTDHPNDPTIAGLLIAAGLILAIAIISSKDKT